MPYIGRLAPAPTGALHIGNARTFLVAWLRARQAGGELILRLEDLDHPKVKPEAAIEAYRDLHWLGLDWDRGPAASFRPFTGSTPNDMHMQSSRLERYHAVLEDLRSRALVYPCVCSRKDLDTFAAAPNAGEDTRERRYPGTCRDRFTYSCPLPKDGKGPGWRFRIEDNQTSSFEDGFCGPHRSVLSDWSGDFLVARGNQVGYQLAVVVDDHDMGITEVVRGDDLLPSTHRQLALYRALGWTPPTFYHLPLVVGPDGRRLAKRHGDSRVSVIRAAGKGPERVLGWLARSLGWADALREMEMAEVISLGDCGRIPRDRVVLRPDDMGWLFQ